MTASAALTFADVRRAAALVRAQLPVTPVQGHPLLDLALGVEVVVKHEHVLPTGSFKVRGGVHLAANLTAAERAHGVVTCSTGNHAQSVAYGAGLAGVPATIVMPSIAPQVKRDAVAALGAEVVVAGDTLGEASAAARALAAESGASFICPTDPRIVLGHATGYLELFEQQPQLAAVYVPIGSGTGAAGACLVRDALAPGCRIVGVQSAAAPAGWRSWRHGRIETAPAHTRASGLATTTGYPLPQQVLAGRLDDFVLVTDDAIDDAARLLATRAHTLAEGAGAAALAGLRADLVAHRAPAGRVAVMCTGANASPEEIARLAAGAAVEAAVAVSAA
ncbi:pyridoxal-phosphate dependent enzyme [Nocardioides sp. zg-ZUI104]|uniref:threonine ammonia-lyase n=1 Tax=Nocardioides faecalis TaxID=2803858 RepID=UPI001BCCA3CF|nr:pyridoxal-phosphate dependent enzyme [Nocardioides faecalis]MBS4751579.1 pyridoxal-phosphate dependent enzyme [Nocardioides faecalis]